LRPNYKKEKAKRKLISLRKGGRRKNAARTQQGCSKDAASMQQGRSKDAASMQQGRSKDAASMQQERSKDAARTQQERNKTILIPTFWPQRWYVSKSLIVEARTRVCWFGLLFCSALLLCSELKAVLAPFTEYRCCRPVLSNWYSLADDWTNACWITG